MSKLAEQRAKRLRRTAYHEAGHAVAASLLDDVSLVAVTVVPGDTGPGHCLWQASAEGSVEPQVMVCLAGISACAAFSGRNEWERSRLDFEVIDELVATLGIGANEKERDAYLERLIKRTEELVHSAPWQAAITAVAEALIERQTLQGDEVSAIIQSAPPAEASE